MSDPVLFLDSLLSALPPLLRIALWATASGVFSMAVYARLSPQQKLTALKVEHKAVRQELKKYDGEFAGLNVLIKRDLTLSFKEMGMIFLPFVVSVGPIIWLMYKLAELYPEAYTHFGPEWMQGFDFWYILVLLIVSVAIKIKFKIV